MKKFRWREKGEQVQIIANLMLELGARLPHIGEVLRKFSVCAPMDVRLDATNVRRYNVASYFLITKTVVVFINRKIPGFARG
jgi:intergrase/recombinase